MSDIAVVGRFAGSIPLGSVGSTTQIIFLFTGILIGLGAGINVIVAFYIGSKNSKSLSDTIHTAAFICLAAGIILLAAGTILARPILAAMNTKSELMEGAVVYLRIYMLGMPALAIYNFGNGVLSATGDTKRPLIFLTVAGIINILLNLFFVIVCNLDTARSRPCKHYFAVYFCSTYSAYNDKGKRCGKSCNFQNQTQFPHVTQNP